MNPPSQSRAERLKRREDTPGRAVHYNLPDIEEAGIGYDEEQKESVDDDIDTENAGESNVLTDPGAVNEESIEMARPPRFLPYGVRNCLHGAWNSVIGAIRKIMPYAVVVNVGILALAFMYLGTGDLVAAVVTGNVVGVTIGILIALIESCERSQNTLYRLVEDESGGLQNFSRVNLLSCATVTYVTLLMGMLAFSMLLSVAFLNRCVDARPGDEAFCNPFASSIGKIVATASPTSGYEWDNVHEYQQVPYDVLHG